MRRVILDLATEDYYGLYEVLWRLNALYSHVSAGEQLRGAQSEMSALVTEGLVDLYRTDGESREFKGVSREVARVVLADAAAWSPPVSRRGERYSFAATAAGESAYRNDPR